jgi:uncharacterized protein VirK/YbjX/glycerophosphoryl diester phosphodiesterase
MVAAWLVVAASAIVPPARAASGPDIFHRLEGRRVAAHRGGYFGKPNTLAQFRSALDEGAADILEMDLRRTADGVVVVFHDDNLKHARCKGAVETTRFAALERCRLDSGERIPRFQDVLALVHGRMVLDPEMKTDAVAGPAARLVVAAEARDWVYFQTQDSPSRYRLARAVDPRIAIIAKADTPDSLRWIAALHDPYVVAVDMERDQLSPGLVQRVHALHQLVSVDSWRFQFTEERFGASCDRVFRTGTDIAVTNNPRSCRRQVQTRNLASLGPLWWLDRQHVRHLVAEAGGFRRDVAVLGAMALASALLVAYLRARALGGAAAVAFPRGRLRHFKRARFVARALASWRSHAAWMQLLATPELRPLVERNPAAFTKVQRSFACTAFTPADRLRALQQHYAALPRLPGRVRRDLHRAEGFELCNIEHGGITHVFRLMTLPEYSREGEVTLRWFAESRIVCSLTFLACAPRVRPMSILVGGIQGASGEGSLELFRELTKAMHGLRPTCAMVHVMRAVTRAFGMQSLLAVGDDRHALTRKRALHRVHASYDAIWRENGGAAGADGLFSLPLETPRRQPGDIPVHKRAAYRRRYALLDDLDARVAAALREVARSPP